MPQRSSPTPRAELGLPDDALVLLSANQVFKITPPLFDAWMKILQAAPQAVLWQLTGGEVADAHLRAEAQARGVDPKRLVFAPKLDDMQAHARRLGAADLALDTWPCNGHTTTSDALAAGVPVLALKGEGFAGRVAASILKTAGLGELVCESVPAYIEQACTLANDNTRLTELRARATQHPGELFDATRFARKLERMYERMWKQAAAGLPPAALPAEMEPLVQRVR
jgi:predicted O-linked N-acetylglucosamine transferase (SPINDLY family)